MDNKFKNAIAFGGFIIFVIIIGVIFSDGSLTVTQSQEEIVIENIEKNEEDSQTELICVYIIGAVQKPGVVLVPIDSRLYQAVEQTGGFTEDADINLINLAAHINDGEKIVIPFKDAEKNKSESQKQINDLYYEEVSDNSGLININTATKEELKTLSGIGDSTADKIIEYRNSISKFKNIEELQNVSGIGETKFNSIKNKITI